MIKKSLFSNPGHILPLDGVRGLAILLVIVEHGTHEAAMSTKLTEWFRKLMVSGWIGVDLFFVLSGFLITGILLRAKGKEGYFKNFYARRIVRIWPLYLFAVITALVIVPMVIAMRGTPDPTMETLLSKQRFIWLHSVNFGMFFYPVIFRQAAVGVTHFWSLAVEEHFYLVWPFLVYLFSLKSLRKVCLLIIGLAFLARCVGVYLGLHPFYFTLTFCRFDALAIGALLATFAHENTLEKLLPYAKWTAIAAAAILAAFFLKKRGLWPWHPFIFTVGLTLIALGFGSLLVLTLHGPACLAAAFSTPFLLMCGRYSYGWYVIDGILNSQMDSWFPWDRVVLVTGSREMATLSVLLLKALVSFVIAVAIWHSLENPILKLKKHFSPRRS